MVIKGIPVCQEGIFIAQGRPSLTDAIVISQGVYISKHVFPGTSSSGDERVMGVVPLPLLPIGEI
jgi:hypothetical protein